MLMWEQFFYYPRANGAKRRSGRKPETRVTNSILTRNLCRSNLFSEYFKTFEAIGRILYQI